MKNTENPENALNKAVEKLENMSDEELKEELDKIPGCESCTALYCPDPNCGGPCQGMGNCFDCRRFCFDVFGIDEGNYIPGERRHHYV